MQTNIDRTVEIVLARFDFNKVHGVMTHLNWTWHFGGNPRVPTVEELRVHAEILLKSMLAYNQTNVNPGGPTRCGGFAVFYRRKEIHLTFELQNAWHLDK